jgi:hypothetical protein
LPAQRVIVSTPDTIQADHAVWDNMFFMTKILRSDASLMIRKIDWETNSVYIPFNKDVNQYEAGEKFYAFNNTNRRVYLCLASPPNVNAKSIYPPTGSEIAPEVKPDGYTWKFLYEISEEDLEKFDYPGFIPIKEISTDLYLDERLYQQNVQAATIRGAIEAIDVHVQGNAYPGAANVNFADNLYSIVNSGVENDQPYVTINPTGKSELIQIEGFYNKKYVIAFNDGYVATIESSYIDTDTGLLKFVLCDSSSTELPTGMSVFCILPKVEIIGNGKDAIAIPVLTSDKLITKIRMVRGGTNYSYVEAKMSILNGTQLKPLIGLNGLVSDITEILGTRHLMVAKSIKPVTSLGQDDSLIFSVPENTAVVYNNPKYTNVISPDTYYTQLALIKSPKKLVNNLEVVAGTTVTEVREMTLEAINPIIHIFIGSTNGAFNNSSNFFQVGDTIVRGPSNYPDQFRAIITEIININSFQTQLICTIINGAFETYAGYPIRNLQNTPTDTNDDSALVFLDCNENCSNNIYVVYQNIFRTSDFVSDNTLMGQNSFANAEIIQPLPEYSYVNPLYPTIAKIKVKDADTGFIPARYENGEYYPGEIVSSIKIIDGESVTRQTGKLVSISEPIQLIGDDNTIGYSYILECTIDRGEGQINTPEKLVNSDGISLNTNTIFRQGTTGSLGKIIRTALPSDTGNENTVYLYVNNYNGEFVVSDENLYIIDNLYNPVNYTNMKLKISNVIYSPSLVRYSGKLLYINDAGPVQRRLENTENLKLLIEF